MAKIEVLDRQNKWVEVPEAEGRSLDNDRFEVDFPGVPVWARVDSLDRSMLQIDGRQAYRVIGVRITPDGKLTVNALLAR